MESKNIKKTIEKNGNNSIDNAKSNTEAESKTKAKELLKQLGVKVLYHTSDGYWFTRHELANQHALIRNVDIEEYKE